MSMLRDTTVLLILSLALAACASPPIPLHDSAGAAGPLANIVLPEQIEIVSVNGLAIEGTRGMFGKGETVLEVSPGRYEVLAFYRELWDRGDQHDVLRSDPALFAVNAAPGGRYRLAYKPPGTVAEARALAEDFSGWVEDATSGARTPSTASGLQFRRGLVAAATFDGSLEPVAPASGTRQAVAPLPTGNTNAEAQPPAAVVSVQQSVPIPVLSAGSPVQAMTPATTPQEAEDWLALMKSWWGEASAEERREFLRWVGERR